MTTLKPLLSKYTNYREYLKDYYLYRRFSNKGWSFAKWAKETGVGSPSLLNMIVKGRRHPSRDLVNKLIVALEFSADEAKRFRILVGIGRSEERSVVHLEDFSEVENSPNSMLRITFDVDKQRLSTDRLEEIMLEIRNAVTTRIGRETSR